MLWQEAAGMSFDMPEGYAHVPQRDLGTWASPPIGPTQRAMVTIQAGLTPLPLTPELRAQVIQEMDSWRLTAVVLGPDQHAHQLRDFFDQVLGRQPERVGGVDIWWLRKP
jgi:hypothetical protein